MCAFQGLCASVSGGPLIRLEMNAGVPESTAFHVFTARSVGMLLGGALGESCCSCCHTHSIHTQHTYTHSIHTHTAYIHTQHTHSAYTQHTHTAYTLSIHTAYTHSIHTQHTFTAYTHTAYTHTSTSYSTYPLNKQTNTHSTIYPPYLDFSQPYILFYKPFPLSTYPFISHLHIYPPGFL